MLNKRIKLTVIAFVLLIIVTLIITVIPSKKENDVVKKEEYFQPYLERAFSVNNDKEIAYVTNSNDSKVIIIYDQKTPENSSIFPISDEIADMDFSYDGDTLYFATNDTISNEELLSSFYKLTIESKELTKIHEVNAIVMDIKVDSAESNIIYNRANEYKDMGGITGKVRSDFNVYKLNLNDQSEQQLTFFGGKEVRGLSFTSNEDGALVSIGKNIWEIPFNPPDNKKKIITAEEQVYDITLNQDNGGIIYSMPKKGDGGIFDYELYHQNYSREKSLQITENKHNTQNPVLLNNGELYYVVDINFGKGYPIYNIYSQKDMYKMDTTKIRLPDYSKIQQMIEKTN